MMQIDTYYANVKRVVYRLDHNTIEKLIIRQLTRDNNMSKEGVVDFRWLWDEQERPILEITKTFETRTGPPKEE